MRKAICQVHRRTAGYGADFPCHGAIERFAAPPIGKQSCILDRLSEDERYWHCDKQTEIGIRWSDNYILSGAEQQSVALATTHSRGLHVGTGTRVKATEKREIVEACGSSNSGPPVGRVEVVERLRQLEGFRNAIVTFRHIEERRPLPQCGSDAATDRTNTIDGEKAPFARRNPESRWNNLY